MVKEKVDSRVPCQAATTGKPQLFEPLQMTPLHIKRTVEKLEMDHSLAETLMVSSTDTAAFQK